MAYIAPSFRPLSSPLLCCSCPFYDGPARNGTTSSLPPSASPSESIEGGRPAVGGGLTLCGGLQQRGGKGVGGASSLSLSLFLFFSPSSRGSLIEKSLTAFFTELIAGASKKRDKLVLYPGKRAGACPSLNSSVVCACVCAFARRGFLCRRRRPPYQGVMRGGVVLKEKKRGGRVRAPKIFPCLFFAGGFFVRSAASKLRLF